jgi:tRNA(fMet)-specific endonuclease VapC
LGTHPSSGKWFAVDVKRIQTGPEDLRIVSIVLTNGCTVVTRNRQDFERVPGLVVKDGSVSAT